MDIERIIGVIIVAAFAVGLFFMCSIQNGEYTVEAEDSELENLGY